MGKNLARPLAVIARLALLAVLPGTALAVPIPGLFNTGVDASGNALAAGAVDPHYAILETGSAAVVVKDAIPSTWIDNASTYRWVWETVAGTPTNVIRTFRTTFDLSGLDPATAALSGTWATDNSGLDILINGTPTGNTCGGFSSFCSFSVTSGFVAGVNTLDFRVQDVGVISGFLVGSISGTADPLGTVREPPALALALAGLAVATVRRRRKPVVASRARLPRAGTGLRVAPAAARLPARDHST